MLLRHAQCIRVSFFVIGALGLAAVACGSSASSAQDGGSSGSGSGGQGSGSGGSSSGSVGGGSDSSAPSVDSGSGGDAKVSAAFTRSERAWNDRREGPPLNVFVSGSSGSRQVAYRFTGWDIQTGTDDDCKAAAQAAPVRPITAASTGSEFNQAYWAVWRNGAADEHR